VQHIDVSDLPEPLARAVAAVVEALRQQFAADEKKLAVQLPLWQGSVIGNLTREEIYGDRI
jgi:hypothetical protein